MSKATSPTTETILRSSLAYWLHRRRELVRSLRRYDLLAPASLAVCDRAIRHWRGLLDKH